MHKTAQAPSRPFGPQPNQPPPLAPPKVGDEVDFVREGETAARGGVIRKVYRPDDPMSHVDLVIDDGIGDPEILVYVERNPRGGPGWRAPGDYTPPPTIDEQLAELETQGERVPRVGSEVVLLRAEREGARVRTLPRRARVTDVVEVGPSGIRVDLAWWPSESAPEDPRAEDPPFGKIERVRQWAGARSGNDLWCWPDEKASSYPDVHEDEFLPKDPCPRCGVASPRYRLVAVKADGRELGRVCPACVDGLAEVLTPMVSAG